MNTCDGETCSLERYLQDDYKPEPEILPCKCCGEVPKLQKSYGVYSLECERHACNSYYCALGTSKEIVINLWNDFNGEEKRDGC